MTDGEKYERAVTALMKIGGIAIEPGEDPKTALIRLQGLAAATLIAIGAVPPSPKGPHLRVVK